MRFLSLFFICFLVCGNIQNLFAAYAGDSYFIISGGLKTSYNFDLNLPFTVPDQVRKDEASAQLESIPIKVKDAATTFVNNNIHATVSKGVSFGINGNFGYAFNRYFKGEIEGSYYSGKLTSSSGWYPYLKNVSQQSTTPGKNINSASDDKFSNFDIMANVIFDLENASNIVPFIGVGFGASIDNFWGSSLLVFQYHFFGGIDLALTPYLYATMNFNYMKSKDGNSVIRVKQKKTFTDTGSSSSTPASTFPQASIDAIREVAFEFNQLKTLYISGTISGDVYDAAKGEFDVAITELKNTMSSDNKNRSNLLTSIGASNSDYDGKLTTLAGVANNDNAGIIDSADHELIALAQTVSDKVAGSHGGDWSQFDPSKSVVNSPSPAQSSSGGTDEYIVFDTSSSVNSKVSTDDNRFRITVGLKFII